MKKLILSALIAAVTAVSTSAVPARRGPFVSHDTDGKEILVQRVGDERGSWFLDMDGNLLMRTDRGFDFARIEADGTLCHSDAPVRFSRSLFPARAPLSPAAVGAIGRFPGTSFPSSGKQKAIVILVEFQDVKFSLGEDTRQYFSDMLNKDGFSEYGGTGSAREYFREMSSGKFECDFDVYGPVTLQKDHKYYGQNDKYGTDMYAYKMAIEACTALDAEVDFSQYDRDNDGDIDNVFIFYAGQGEASAYPADNPDNDYLVWPHSYYVSVYGTYKFDGKRLNSYGCTNELSPIYSRTALGNIYKGLRPDGVGTFVHEFSHILGLPDLYLTDESELTTGEKGYFTPGEWSVLDYGPYNNNGCTPPAYTAFERNALGWITLEEITPDMTTCELTHIEESNRAYSITKHNKSTEFYLFECRKRSGWDTYIPYDGMLVWHIDYDSSRWNNNSVNNKGSHQYVDLIEADGIAEKTYRNGGDCFPGTKKVTELVTKWWDKSSTGFKLSDITLTPDLSITFTVNSGNDPAREWLNVAQLLDSRMDDSEVAVRGYIVGYVKSGAYSAKSVVFGSQSASQSNIVIADSPDETDVDRCVPVQLSKDTPARNDLNLSANPSMLGHFVELNGTASIYVTAPGMKNVTTYTLLDEKDPDASVVEVAAETTQSAVYDLQGRRVLVPKSGNIYISGGKLIRF